ncbi:hypothetical protein Q3V30_21585 (plasmid) [Erwinia pyri]|uniref:Uncharacterized protein n=1 Tax=Erwinia pyri TaxID=3062598 RepID=A0AA50DNB5_9GAMM|nr:hypothetical protein [Erwinia sp. DE2]WLS81071.1 hypothetical protein Q3V30_21585 [Erwinia sp. DE2]
MQHLPQTELHSLGQAENYLQNQASESGALESLIALAPASLEKAVSDPDSRHYLMMACRSALKRVLEEFTLEENINNLSVQLDPQKITTETSLSAPLIKLFLISQKESGKNFLKAIDANMADTLNAYELWLRNDTDLLLKLTNVLRLTNCKTLEAALQIVTLHAIQDCLPALTRRDLAITDCNEANLKSASFNRLLPAVGMVSQRYGHLGRKILLNGITSFIEGNKQADRYKKLEKLVTAHPPSEAAVNRSMSDYYLDYVMNYGDELDEPVVMKMPSLFSSLKNKDKKSKGKGKEVASQPVQGSSSSSSAITALQKSGNNLVLGNVTFICDMDKSRMQQVADFVSRLPISQILHKAGPLAVRLGSTTGRTPGEWNSGSRTITLDPNHITVQKNRGGDVSGTALFELLNAASDNVRQAAEQCARSGEFEQMAHTTGWPAATLFARELEYQEFNNAKQHHEIMVQAGLNKTPQDIFRHESGDFESFFNRQVATGHTHSYEQPYNFLRPFQPEITQEYRDWQGMIKNRREHPGENSGEGSARDYYGY